MFSWRQASFQVPAPQLDSLAAVVLRLIKNCPVESSAHFLIVDVRFYTVNVRGVTKSQDDAVTVPMAGVQPRYSMHAVLMNRLLDVLEKHQQHPSSRLLTAKL